MKDIFQHTMSQYTRYSSHTTSLYTPKHYTATQYSSTHYTPSHYSTTQYSSTHYTPSHYSTTQYSSTHYTPSHYSTKQYSSTHYTPTHYTATHYTPTQHTPARYTHTQHKQSSVKIKPVRTVRFPNDIVFQDHVRQGDLEQIGRFLRARKVRLDTIYLSGMAALHEAVLSGNLDCVKLLVSYGADVHQRDEDGWTPLHMACSDGYPDIAQYLLSLGASVEAQNDRGEKPADLIDPDCKDLVKLFEVGCV